MNNHEDFEFKESINRLDIIKQLEPYFLSHQDARIAVFKVFEIISQALQDNKKVVISNFGTFIPKEILPREMTNPKTKESVIAKSRLSIRFHPAKKLIKYK